MYTPHLLAAFRAAIEHISDDNDARALLVPRFLDGRPHRLHAPLPGIPPRLGAVLVALYAIDDQIMVPLTVRSSALRHHRGEISLPGGRIDPEDASLVAAALREAEEEIGLRGPLDVWGTLSEVYIAPSNFLITPVVGWLDTAPSLYPAEAEVAEIIHLPLFTLLQPETLAVEERIIRDQPLQVPFFRWQEYKIWGATSIVLSQLAARLRMALAATGAMQSPAQSPTTQI